MTTTTAPAPFIADGWLKITDDERDDLVRPFYAEYLAAREQVAALPWCQTVLYNDDFRGRIPSIDPAQTGTTEKDQDTAIYLLQTLHRKEEMRASVAAFLAAGGRHITLEDLADGKVLRGTVARYGWYSGGTGWEVREDVRVMSTGGRFPKIIALPKGRRTNGYDLGTERVLFREGGKR